MGQSCRAVPSETAPAGSSLYPIRLPMNFPPALDVTVLPVTVPSPYLDPQNIGQGLECRRSKPRKINTRTVVRRGFNRLPIHHYLLSGAKSGRAFASRYHVFVVWELGRPDHTRNSMKTRCFHIQDMVEIVLDYDKQYVQMPGKITKSILRPPFRPPQIPAALRSSRLSCGKIGKAQIFTSARELILGNPG